MQIKFHIKLITIIIIKKENFSPEGLISIQLRPAGPLRTICLVTLESSQPVLDRSFQGQH